MQIFLFDDGTNSLEAAELMVPQPMPANTASRSVRADCSTGNQVAGQVDDGRTSTSDVALGA